ncbi:MAG: DNA primase noncatalytic subunit PriX [Nitrososphaeraceae archaeon]|nr:DNA primase noncatalytic subunit PriX [Nitrososphaeraceae archaeon]
MNITNIDPADTIHIDKDKAIDGINSLISMFEIIGQPIFPRNIMTAEYSGFFTVHDIGQLFDAFERASFKDCRISAYPQAKENNMLIPNLLLLDLDYDHRLITDNSKEYADQILRTKVNKILKRLQLTYHISNFMVMRTGNGRHILLPFLFDTPFEYVEEFSMYLPLMRSKSKKNVSNIISEEFLPFAKKYLSNNQADLGNHPNFASLFLRVPGTINMKMKYGTIEIVKIEHEWSYESDTIPGFGDLHPDTDIFYDFMHHLALAAGNYQTKNRFGGATNSTTRKKNTSRSYNWVEVLWDTGVSDCRKRILWLILTPYAINVKKMLHQDAFIWVKQWADRCDSITKFDPNYNIEEKIDYYLNVAKDTGYLPPSLEKLATYQWKLTDGIDLYDLIKNKMNS